MNTTMKVSIKEQRIVGTVSRMRSRMSITFKCVFSGEIIFCFLQKYNMMFVKFIHVYRKYHISMYFLRKIIFHFPSKENISYFPEKNTIFPRKFIFHMIFIAKTIFSEHLKKMSYFHVFLWQRSSSIFRLKNRIIFSGKRNIIFPDNTTRKIIFPCDFFGKTIFSEHFKKISYFHVFFEKDCLSFTVWRIRWYFQKKEISFFLIIQERSDTSAIFSERPSFQNIWKKKIWFFMQCLKWRLVTSIYQFYRYCKGFQFQ